MSDIDNMASRLATQLDEMKHIEDTWGADRTSWPAGQAERYERLRASTGRLTADMEDHDAAAARAREARDEVRELARSNPARVEPVETGEPASRRRADPWSAGAGDDVTRMDSPTGLAARARDAVEYAQGLPTAARSMLSAILDRDQLSTDAAYVLAASSDHYRTAFEKVVMDPVRGHLLWTDPEREAYARVETVRAAMKLSDVNGGYLMPLSLDPTVMLTNAGAISPVRQLARVEQTITRDWNGVTSAGVTAEWLAEGAQAADASPTFARVTVNTHKGAAWLYGSYEVFEDTNAVSQLPTLIADARARQEAAAFVTGDGTDGPLGIITAISTVTGSTVTATTRGVFGIPDIYAVWDAVTPRTRASSKAAWMANNTILTRVRRFDSTGGADLWVQLADGTPPNLIGKQIHEASTMTDTITSGSRSLILGDFGEYLIVDRIGTTLVEVPMLMGDDKRPTYQKGWAAYYRVGAKPTNPDAFRLLLC